MWWDDEDRQELGQLGLAYPGDETCLMTTLHTVTAEPPMSDDSVYVVTVTEGEYSSREWEVTSVCSDMNTALDRACAVAAQEFRDTTEPWNRFHSRCIIETWTMNGSQQDYAHVTNEQIKERHPELKHINDARTEDARMRHRAAIDGQRLFEQQKLDDALRNRATTVEKYLKATEDLHLKYQNM